jgi:hypothetical protein
MNPDIYIRINRIESGQVFHRADAAALANEPLALARSVADGHRLVVDTHTLPAQVIAMRVRPKGHVDALCRPPGDRASPHSGHRRHHRRQAGGTAQADQ